MRNQIDDDLGHVIGLTAPTRDFVLDSPPNPVFTEPGQHVRDPNAVVANLLHQRFAERVERRLRRAVRGAVDERILAGKAADVDDPAAAARLQVRKRRMAAVEDAGQVRVDDAVPLVDASSRRRAGTRRRRRC